MPLCNNHNPEKVKVFSIWKSRLWGHWGNRKIRDHSSLAALGPEARLASQDRGNGDSIDIGCFPYLSLLDSFPRKAGRIWGEIEPPGRFGSCVSAWGTPWRLHSFRVPTALPAGRAGEVTTRRALVDRLQTSLQSFLEPHQRAESGKSSPRAF